MPKSEYQKLYDQLQSLQRRLSKRQQQESDSSVRSAESTLSQDAETIRKRLKKLKEQERQQQLELAKQNNKPTIKRDLEKARLREAREVRQFQDSQSGIRRVKYPTAQETRDAAKSESEFKRETSSSSSSSGPRKTSYPTAEETRAAAAPTRVTTSVSGTSTPPRRGAGERTPLSGGAGGTRPPSSAASGANSQSSSADEKKDKRKGLKGDFKELKKLNKGRLAAALEGAQDEILKKRGLK